MGRNFFRATAGQRLQVNGGVALDVKDTHHIALDRDRNGELGKGLTGLHPDVARILAYIRHQQGLALSGYPARDAFLAHFEPRCNGGAAGYQAAHDAVKGGGQRNAADVADRPPDPEIAGLVRERLPRITLDFDGSVLSTQGHAEGTAVGFNPKKKGARSYYPLF